MARMVAAAVMAMALLLMPFLSKAVDIHQIRQIAAEYNVTCVLVFGDSSVDPGNNNRLPTFMKGNFLPYGKDFFNGRPTGRFCNGRLATDFIAEAIGYTKAIPAFLDPHIKPVDLLHGVSFASAASGYDDLTANISNVLPVSKQLEYFRQYKIHVVRLVGEKKANEIINNAVFVMSMGTNDFLQNYYLDPTRSQQYTVEEYENYLVSLMEMHRLGARRLIVVGVPPLGCMPLVKTLKDEKGCVESYNQAASSFNTKIEQKLVTLRQTLGIKYAFVDCYGMILNAIHSPRKFGFVETGKGCCGTGTIEYGDSCRGMSTCPDASKYTFWDAVHPTQRMYQIIADEAINSLNAALLQ
ncbi:GDSL esterase/lipase At5g45950 isoform X2 [Ricinus communis]|uniref:GDSL esterase/lipase At5g45950 isoform X2 n=1 Tax=Ricinus communis TaxID=3988 RepID=UPI00201A400E|nr:GDSL esterase/lipase At5g45950 isoform X2 [Ricinus communis]